MSTNEVTELIIQWIGPGLASVTLYLTVLSGYVVLGLSVAKVLSRFQVLLVTLVFILFVGFFTIGTFMFREKARATVVTNPTAGFEMPVYWGQIIAGTEVMGVVGALYFMLSLRRSGV